MPKIYRNASYQVIREAFERSDLSVKDISAIKGVYRWGKTSWIVRVIRPQFSNPVIFKNEVYTEVAKHLLGAYKLETRFLSWTEADGRLVSFGILTSIQGSPSWLTFENWL